MIWSLFYSLKRLWRVKSRLLIMGFFLSLGFSGWLAGESAQTSIKGYLAQNAKQILSADLTISARREFKPDELTTIKKLTQNQGELQKGYEFFAMMTVREDTRLVLVRVIDDSYPFYGELKVNPTAQAKNLRNKKLWAYEEFKSLIDLELSQNVILGDSKFEVTGFVTEDKTQTFRLASLAPRIFIHLSDLEETHLIQFGSTFTTTYFLKAQPEAKVEMIADSLKKALPDPGIDVSNYISLPDEESSPTQRLADFLGLTSLVTLLFSALSLFYLIQVWSIEQQKERALLNTFGVNRAQQFAIELIQSFFVAMISTVISVSIVLLTKPAIEMGLKNWMNQSFILVMSWREITLILISQFVLLIALSNPFSKSKQNSTAQLLKNNFITQQSGVLRFAPLFILLWPYAVMASQSFRNGTYFFIGLLSISLSLVFFGRISISLLSNTKWKSWKTSLAIKSLKRQSTASWAFLFTVGLSSSLLNLIPQIQNSVENLLTFDEIQSRPSLFMFDIQSEQWPDMKMYLNDNKIQPTAVSPLVRARILKINNENFERKELTGQFKSREEEESNRSRNRAVNITYRSYLQGGEKIVSGKEFPLTYSSQQKYAFVSVEKRYADRIGVSIGDIMTFDIQGIEIEAEIKNLREVKWSRFEPNFFILMQDGILNDAPQTILSSLAYIESEQKNKFIKGLASKFPNVSVIDVERLMSSIIQNLDRVGGALRLMTYLTLLTGLMTILFLLSAEAQRRAFEIHLIKVLGADSRSVIQNRLTEVLVLGSISVVVGVFSSFVIAYAVVDQVFQVSFTPNYYPAVVIISIVLFICWAVTQISTTRQLKKQSYEFLRREE